MLQASMQRYKDALTDGEKACTPLRQGRCCLASALLRHSQAVCVAHLPVVLQAWRYRLCARAAQSVVDFCHRRTSDSGQWFCSC
jgi:hypothetical protein